MYKKLQINLIFDMRELRGKLNKLSLLLKYDHLIILAELSDLKLMMDSWKLKVFL